MNDKSSGSDNGNRSWLERIGTLEHRHVEAGSQGSGDQRQQ